MPRPSCLPPQSLIFIPPTHRVCFQRANCLAFGGDEIAQSGGYLKCGAGGKPSPALRSGVLMLNSASDEILPGGSPRQGRGSLCLDPDAKAVGMGRKARAVGASRSLVPL